MDDYKLLKIVGKGSFGVVYKAIDTQNSREVALKMIDMASGDDDLTDVMLEVTAMCEMESPFIIKYYCSFAHNVFLVIVMEFMGGGSVADILKSRGALEEKYCKYITQCMCYALEYLHSCYKLHRDVKAANILLGLDGSVKLADFGVAGQLTQTVQKCKTFVGTPYWMAPEVISQNEYDNKADIWAIGITCIEMVIGQPPHSKSNPVRALMLIVNGEPPTLPGHFSIQFRNFVASCVEKIPTNRPTATKLLEHAWLSKKVKKNVLLEMKSLHQQNELKGTKNKPDMKNSRENNELDLSYFTFPDVDEKNDTKELNFNLYPTIVEKNPKSLQRSLSSLSQEENFLDMKLARSSSEKEQNVLIRTEMPAQKNIYTNVQRTQYKPKQMQLPVTVLKNNDQYESFNSSSEQQSDSKQILNIKSPIKKNIQDSNIKLEKPNIYNNNNLQIKSNVESLTQIDQSKHPENKKAYQYSHQGGPMNVAKNHKYKQPVKNIRNNGKPLSPEDNPGTATVVIKKSSTEIKEKKADKDSFARKINLERKPYIKSLLTIINDYQKMTKLSKYERDNPTNQIIQSLGKTDSNTLDRLNDIFKLATSKLLNG